MTGRKLDVAWPTFLAVLLTRDWVLDYTMLGSGFSANV